jgi:anti-sigma regulatory factor (Ser/Thr protein kinase)
MLALRLFCAGIGNLAHLSSEEIEDLKLAVSEACFSFPDEEGVELFFHLEQGKVAVELKSVASRKSFLSLTSPSDKGISFLLVRNLMDAVEFGSTQEGTFVRMVKQAKSSMTAGKR